MNPSKVQEVSGLNDEQKQRMYDFLQGAIYSWCKNRENEWFSVQALMGGKNTDWTGTPLEQVYLKHLESGSEDPEGAAGRDAGWLLKIVLDADDRVFEHRDGFQRKEYRWVQS
ncbi:cell division protein SepF [Leptospira wolffii]|nr:cell division protein SepF [Leptospira wolffii]